MNYNELENGLKKQSKKDLIKMYIQKQKERDGLFSKASDLEIDLNQTHADLKFKRAELIAMRDKNFRSMTIIKVLNNRLQSAIKENINLESDLIISSKKNIDITNGESYE